MERFEVLRSQVHLVCAGPGDAVRWVASNTDCRWGRTLVGLYIIFGYG